MPDKYTLAAKLATVNLVSEIPSCTPKDIYYIQSPQKTALKTLISPESQIRYSNVIGER